MEKSAQIEVWESGKESRANMIGVCLSFPPHCFCFSFLFKYFMLLMSWSPSVEPTAIFRIVNSAVAYDKFPRCEIFVGILRKTL